MVVVAGNYDLSVVLDSVAVFLGLMSTDEVVYVEDAREGGDLFGRLSPSPDHHVDAAAVEEITIFR